MNSEFIISGYRFTKVKDNEYFCDELGISIYEGVYSKTRPWYCWKKTKPGGALISPVRHHGRRFTTAKRAAIAALAALILNEGGG